MSMVGEAINAVKPDAFFFCILFYVFKNIYSYVWLQYWLPVFCTEHKMYPDSYPTHSLNYFDLSFFVRLSENNCSIPSIAARFSGRIRISFKSKGFSRILYLL